MSKIALDGLYQAIGAEHFSDKNLKFARKKRHNASTARLG